MATSKLSLSSKIKLRDGYEIPILGFGTYELEGKDAYEGVTWALQCGYRLIDSAEWYENEREVGQAILDFCKKTGTPREEIYYTTKLKLNNGYDHVKKAIKRSLETCGLGYIDLYLIHGPLGGAEARKNSWRAICDFQKENLTLLRSIGISTFGVRHMQELIDTGLPMPVVHQIDLHPFMTRTEIVEFSQKQGMLLEAWGPLTRGLRLEHPTLLILSKKYQTSPAHILLRYSIEKGFVPLPKSASKERIKTNAEFFNFYLTAQEVGELDSLDEYLTTDWDPTSCP
ncbi:Aldo/keto reductase [Crepidotus variabilis]|uniref:Aldo/keto reductase n=1 Tax=Crepidotus variabilis TaxID=179855 RepID=A0A9P6EPS5_9AGAR|nr:Aldo/keto reductase [Crepidotus variabilis]